MPKNSEQESLENFVKLLEQINNKISGARVLNGGFDKLEGEVDEIKRAQLKLVIDAENSKANIERLESKLDKIFDPNDGFYPKIKKTEMMLESLDSKISSLASADERFSKNIAEIDALSKKNEKEMQEIKKITGDDYDNLKKSMKISSTVWWLIGFSATGLLSAIGKLIWDYFISQ